MRWRTVRYYPGSPMANESLLFKTVVTTKAPHVRVNNIEMRVPQWVWAAYLSVFAEGHDYWYADLRPFLFLCANVVGRSVTQRAFITALRLGGRAAACQLVEGAATEVRL